MKNRVILVLGIIAGTAASHGQGTFVFDQQSSTNETAFWGTGLAIQQISKPFGQSFTPALASIDFVSLKLYDKDTNNGLGATLLVNLRADSISGSVVASTTPLFIANGTGGAINFLFSGSISVTPGNTYFLEPVVQSGDVWLIDANEYNYAGGSVFAGGLPVLASDLWFREGIIVPEPSAVPLIVLGAGMLVFARKRRRRST